MIIAAILNNGQRIDLEARNENEAWAQVQNLCPNQKVLTYIHGNIKTKGGIWGVQRYVEDNMN